MSKKYPGGFVTAAAPAGYSVAFDGTGDYLTIANNTALQLGSGDFTVEAWVYVTNAAAYQSIICVGVSTGGSTAGTFTFRIQNDLKVRWCINDNSTGLTSTNAISANTWTNLCVSRASGTLRMFINGVANGTLSDSNNYNNTAGTMIGAENQSGAVNTFYGYISNLRVTKGTALYTAAFTPPTQLFNITNTSLLTCNSPAIVDQSSNAFAITANGDAKVSTFTPFTAYNAAQPFNRNTSNSAPGVWTMDQVDYYMSQNKWPMPYSYPLQSLRFNSADTTYLNRTPASAGNRQIYTWSGWVKRSVVTSGTYYALFAAGLGTGGNNGIFFDTGSGGLYFTATDGVTDLLVSSSVYRDVSAWYHILVAVDTTQVTASNRVKMYVNGVQLTAFSTSTYPAQNSNATYINTTNQHRIGSHTNSGYYYDGYMTEINFIDGQALTPSSFGANDANTGVWSPIVYTGTYGTNGFHLTFQNNTGTTATTLGYDWSGTGNNWTPNNFSITAGTGNDVLTDSPTNFGTDNGFGGEVRGNYCTLNSTATQGTVTPVNGNLDVTNAANSLINGTVMVTSGKWYWEVKPTSGSDYFVGAQRVNVQNIPANKFQVAGGLFYYSFNGNKYINGDGGSAYGSSYTTNDVIGVALNLDANTITFYKNNTSQGSISITAGDWVPCSVTGGTQCTYEYNFGQRPFAYTAPSGFKCLNTANLPTPTIGTSSTTQANYYMDVSLYTGTGANLSVTGLNFQPDLVWLKSRSNALDHKLTDAVRGVTKALISDTNGAETTDTTGLTAFNSNGFTIGSNATYNTNAATYVGWQWKANGAGSSNTSGSITSTVSANTTAGFSVVTYTGTGTAGTIGHGLGVAPKMMFIKSRSDASTSWIVYHSSISPTYLLTLQTTAAQQNLPLYFNSTATAATVFSIGSAANTGTDLNVSGKNYVAYCFAEITGFSKFGSYTGNLSTDGPFVYCGFRPRYVMVKNSSAVGSWWIVDSARSTYNVTSDKLAADSSAAANTGNTDFDFLSNGFKVRNSGSELNGSGNTIIFMAFAESPFNYSRAR